MRIFIITPSSYNFDMNGGIVVFAKGWNRVKELLSEYKTRDGVKFDIRDLKGGPDFEMKTLDCEEQIFDLSTMPYWG